MWGGCECVCVLCVGWEGGGWEILEFTFDRFFSFHSMTKNGRQFYTGATLVCSTFVTEFPIHLYSVLGNCDSENHWLCMSVLHGLHSHSGDLRSFLYGLHLQRDPGSIQTHVNWRQFFMGSIHTQVIWRQFLTRKTHTHATWRHFFTVSILTHVTWRQFGLRAKFTHTLLNWHHFFTGFIHTHVI